MERNLWRAQEKWGRIVKILGREGAENKTVGKFYVEEVQAMLLFGSEMWVVNLWLEKRWMEGMVPKFQLNREWVYPPIGAALETMGLEEISVYIDRWQNIVAQYISTHPIMDLCLAE